VIWRCSGRVRRGLALINDKEVRWKKPAPYGGFCWTPSLSGPVTDPARRKNHGDGHGHRSHHQIIMIASNHERARREIRMTCLDDGTLTMVNFIPAPPPVIPRTMLWGGRWCAGREGTTNWCYLEQGRE
jgi:hypothetical protein